MVGWDREVTFGLELVCLGQIEGFVMKGMGVGVVSKWEIWF